MQDDELNLSMFKAYDIRTAARNLNSQNIKRLFDAMGEYFRTVLRTDTVVIARDARLGAPRLMQSAVECFLDLGFKVILNPDQISTCQFYYTCMQHKEAAGVMITASHNPGDYIGMKCTAPNLVPLAAGSGPEGGLDHIKRCYISGKKPPIPKQQGSIEFVQYGDEFIDYSMKLAGIQVGDLQGKRIMLDFLNGSAGLEITKALIRCGADVNARNLIPDGSFPNGEPNPIVVSSIQPTWDEIKKGGYDFGFCYDGDGDRMDVMNAEGVQLTPSFNMAILLPEIVRLFNTHMGYEHIQSYTGVKSNPLSIRRQYEANSNIHLIRNGHSFIKEALRINMENEYVAAVEETAHYYMNFPYDPEDFKQGLAPTENTLFFTLLTARLWSQNPSAYQSAFEEQKSLYREREWGGHFFDERIVPAVMNEIEEKFKEERVQIIKHMADGGTLDATIFRYGLDEMHEKNDLEGPWFQVSQRISRNEEGIARWEVISSREQFVSQCVDIIKDITDRYVEQGKAEYFN